ncbi:MAG: cytochrome b/b6 domain-containing protein [Bacteroidales bacterium]
MAEKIYFYPKWIRLWHLINAIFIILLIISGISMQYADIDSPFMEFSMAVSLHNFSGVALTISYLLFFIGNVVSPNGKYYRLQLKGLTNRLWKQLRYYAFGVFKGEEAPFPVSKERKFNPLQQISYVFTMYLALPLLFITGWALLFPEFILKQVFKVSGIFLTAQLHIVMGFLVSLFLIIHLYVSTMGKSPTSNFKSMVTGWQEVH